MSGTVASGELAEELWAALWATYGHLRGGSKVLANDAGTSPRTAENWLRRLCLPQGESLVALMAASPAVNDAVQQAVARRIAQTQQRRAAWRADYDVAMGALGAAQAGGAGGLAGGIAGQAGGAAAAVGDGVVIGVDRRRKR